MAVLTRLDLADGCCAHSSSSCVRVGSRTSSLFLVLPRGRTRTWRRAIIATAYCSRRCMHTAMPHPISCLALAAHRASYPTPCTHMFASLTQPSPPCLQPTSTIPQSLVNSCARLIADSIEGRLSPSDAALISPFGWDRFLAGTDAAAAARSARTAYAPPPAARVATPTMPTPTPPPQTATPTAAPAAAPAASKEPLPYYDPNADRGSSVAAAMKANRDFIARLESGEEPKFGMDAPPPTASAEGGEGGASDPRVDGLDLPGAADGVRMHALPSTYHPW